MIAAASEIVVKVPLTPNWAAIGACLTIIVVMTFAVFLIGKK